MKQYSAYIFDLDGTLLNTLDGLFNAVNHTLHAMNHPERTLAEVRSFLGNGQRNLLTKSLPATCNEADIDRALSIFKAYYLQHGMEMTEPFPGILAMLAELQRRGKKIAVVSNKFHDATQAMCKHYFADYISLAIGEREGLRRKPAADMVTEAMRQLGADAADTVYVGDSEVDILTAQNSGLDCIVVEWGFRDKPFLVEQGGKTFAATPEDIIAE